MNSGLILALIPIVAYLCLVIFLFNRNQGEDLRLIILYASIIFAVYIILVEEVLSLFQGITRVGLIAAWAVMILVLAGYFVRLRRNGLMLLPRITPPSSWDGWLSLLLILFVLAITFVVAWLSPPQTWDSLSYHMSRIAHWAQNQSVADYITGIERQNSMNPGGEMISLSTYVLIGGDRLATFTQWFAMLGSVLGVSLIACYLGAKKYGQWLAAGFAITVPMGMVQASSTITDYIATFWVICVITVTVNYHHSRNDKSLLFLGLAAGLALLTKSTTIPFLLPFAIWLAILIIRRNKPLQMLRWGFTIALLAMAINTPFFVRNLQTYGTIYNPVDTQKHLNQLRTIPGTLSILLRNVGQQAGFPKATAWNNWLGVSIIKVHGKLGLTLDDPRTTNEGYFKVTAPFTGEDFATNPFHAALILVCIPLSFLFRKKSGWLSIIFLAAAAGGYLLFSFLYKWNIFGVRYQLIFFILITPFLGIVLGRIERLKVGLLIAYGLLFVSLPWLFQIDSRPIIPRPGFSLVGSILVEPRETLYYANDGGSKGAVYDAMHQFAAAIKAQGCTQVGLMLSGDAPEYLVWEAMGAPDASLRMEWNIVGGYSDKYAAQDFHPCAFICQGCLAGGQKVREQNIFLTIWGYELFMNPAKP